VLFDITHITDRNYPEIISAMTQAGFKLWKQFGSLEFGLEFSFRRNNFNVDMFTFYKDIVRSHGNETESIWNSVSSILGFNR
jgi:hypothetical protein